MRTGFGLILAVAFAAPALAADGTPWRADGAPRQAFPRPAAGDPHRDWRDSYWDRGSYWQERDGDRHGAGGGSGWGDGHHDREMPRH